VHDGYISEIFLPEFLEVIPRQEDCTSIRLGLKLSVMAQRRRRVQEDPRGASIRHLLLIVAERLLERLTLRAEDMVALFSRRRERAPMLTVVESLFETATFEDLASLKPAEQRSAFEFHTLLREFRWYLEYTEDMPSTVHLHVESYRRRLIKSGGQLRLCLEPKTKAPPRSASPSLRRRASPR
jgi:hypothetical protein